MDRPVEVRDPRPFGLRILGRPDEPLRLSALRVLVLLAALIVVSNLLGVAAVYGLAAFVVPGPSPRDTAGTALDNLILGLAWTAVFTAGALVWGRRHFSERTSWLASRRAPTEAEQKGVLRLPLVVAGFQGAYWLGAAAIFALFNSVLADRLTVQIAVTLALSGLFTSVDSFVVAEIICRPLAARALAEGVPAGLRAPGVRVRAVLSWFLSSALPVAGLMLVASASLARPGFTVTRLAVTVLAIGGAILVIGFRTTLVAARANADPIDGLRRAMARIEGGDFDVTVPIYDGSEIGRLQAGFNRMAAGLLERERIRAVFEHHVGPEVARTALAGEAGLGGDVRRVGVLFVDLVASTALPARMAPDDVVRYLNEFFAVVVEVVAAHGGIVNKFEGDGAMVVFGAPAACPDPAGSALAAGRDLAAALAGRLPAGIGISGGPVVAGNVGSPDRYEYTVIGDPVNEAARLTDLAKGMSPPILASWSAVEAASPEEARCWRRGDEVTLRGRAGVTRLGVPV